MSDSVISVKGLYKSFGSLNVLENVDLEVKKGEKIAIIGGSGCGKSVFLRSLELLEKPDKGSITICQEEITAKGANVDSIRKYMGMVYQNFCLFEHMNVMDNLCFAPMKLLKMSRGEAEKKALGLLKEVGLAERAYAWPDKLSGGQKQRVAIARCLMMEPEIMLFDEPTSALDPTMVGEVLATIRLLSKKGLTMIVVTHEMNFAKSFADRVLFFADKGIYEQGSPKEIFENPQKEKTIAFIQKIKNFDYHISSKDFDIMEMQGGIHNFCDKYGLDNKMLNKIQLYCEEISEEMLEHMKGNIDIDISLTYSEEDKKINVNFTWNEDIGNPLDNSNDEVRGMILKKISTKAVYSFDEKYMLKVVI